MLIDDIADQLAIACHPDEIEGLIADAWGRHRDGHLTANDLEALQEAALARMNAFPERHTETRPKPRPAPSDAPRAAARRRQRSPDRQASIERRRRLAASGPMPPALAARFTTGELAALRIVGDEVRLHGCCALHLDAIAARSGTSRPTVQRALRLAKLLGHLTVEERRRRGQRSLTNVVRIVSPEWSTWIRHTPKRIGCQNRDTTDNRFKNSGSNRTLAAFDYRQRKGLGEAARRDPGG
jgi:hypothetical protein